MTRLKNTALIAVLCLLLGGCANKTATTEPTQTLPVAQETTTQTETTAKENMIDLDGDGIPDEAVTRTVPPTTEPTTPAPTEATTTEAPTTTHRAAATQAVYTTPEETVDGPTKETTQETTADPTETFYMYTNATCNVRTGPGTTFQKYKTLSAGVKVTCTGKTDGWYIIRLDGGTYYISGNLLSKTAPATDETTATAQETTATPETAPAETAPVQNQSTATRTVLDNGAILYNVGSSITVAVDAGHQAHSNSNKEPEGPGSDVLKTMVSTGTSGVATGVNESVLNLAVSLKLRDELISRGYNVLMIRETQDVDISNATRAVICNTATIAVHIHANGVAEPEPSGSLCVCPSENNAYVGALSPLSQVLGTHIVNKLCALTGAQNRSLMISDTMTSINWSTVPVTIVELGFMTNPNEDLLMQDPNYQYIMAVGIANGIDAYFGR